MRVIDSISNWLNHLFFEDGKLELSNVEYDRLKGEVYFKELALTKIASLLGGIVASSEFKFYMNDKLKKGYDYYSFNVQPNKNENASKFWMKIMSHLVFDNEALVIFVNDQWFVADSFFRDDTKVLFENTYHDVIVDGLQFNKVFKESEILYFSLNDENIAHYIDGVYASYGELLAATKDIVLSGADKNYWLNIDAMAAGDPKFKDKLAQMTGERLKKFFKHGKTVMPVYAGFKYENANNKTNVPSSTDYRELRKDVFSFCAESYKVPVSLMFGDTAEISNEVFNNLVTLAAKPYIDMIRKEMQRKIYSELDFINNCKIEIDISKAKYRDVLELAVAIDKLLGSGTFCIDEIREELGKHPLNTEFSRKHFMTKNYSSIEELLKDLNVVEDVHKTDGTMTKGGV